jgi:VanZ family protein
MKGISADRTDKGIFSRGWLRASGLACVIAIAVLSLIPGHWQARTGAPPYLEHVVAYFGTATLLGLGWRGRIGRATIAILLIVYAALMEVLQHWSPGRDPAVSDILASGMGALLGALVATVVVKFVRPHD